MKDGINSKLMTASKSEVACIFPSMRLSLPVESPFVSVILPGSGLTEELLHECLQPPSSVLPVEIFGGVELYPARQLSRLMRMAVSLIGEWRFDAAELTAMDHWFYLKNGTEYLIHTGHRVFHLTFSSTKWASK